MHLEFTAHYISIWKMNFKVVDLSSFDFTEFSGQFKETVCCVDRAFYVVWKYSNVFIFSAIKTKLQYVIVWCV